MKKSLLSTAIGLIMCLTLSAQINISGVVVDEGGEPLIGVNVLEVNTSNGTITDFDGNFSLDVSEGATLRLSYTGFNNIEMPAGDGSGSLEIVMKEGLALDEVVVTALGISREKKSLTYAAQNVSTEELKQARTTNLVNSLQGKVAGLSITSSAEGVGGGSKVLLRGNRSISGSSEPLYVVDGIILDGDIRNLSPDDIEDISVLRGANAAAIYGSRANNGAIIVTTKSGKGAANGVTTSLGINFQASAPIHLLKYQNQYGQGSQGVYSPTAVTSWGPRFDGSQVDHWSNDPNFSSFGSTYRYSAQPDNIEDFFQTGYNFATNLGVNVKGDQSNTFLSYTYNNAEGIIPGNDLESHNLSGRFTADITSRLSTDAKVNYIRQDFGNVLTQGENFDNPLRYLYKLPRNIRTEDLEHYEFTNAAGQNRQHYYFPNFNGGGNPYWTINNVLRPRLTERVIGMFSLKYQLTDDLSVLVRSALDRTNNQEEFSRKNDTYTTAPGGSYQKNFNQTYEWNSDFLVTYDTRWSEDISFNFNFGGNLRNAQTDILRGFGANFVAENLFSLTNTTNPLPFESEGALRFQEREVQSLYGFGSIGFFDGLYLEFSGRNDWSSTLPADNRSYFYPSVGLTAVVSDLVDLPSIFSFLKLRGSWAEVGNDTDPYSLFQRAVVEFGTVRLEPVRPVSDLRPETTRSTEFGFDSRFLDNLIRFDFTYYKTSSFDQLFSTPVPVGSGVGAVFQNGGDIENKGVEIVLGATPISNQDFTWDINLNFSKNESEVLEIAEGFDILTTNTDFIRSYNLVVGEQFGDVYSKGFERDGQGRVIVDDNGLPTVTSGLSERIANFNPDWLGSVNNSFSYKNFNMSFLIDIRQGGTVTAFTEAILARDGLLEYTLPGRESGVVFGESVFGQYEAVLADGSPNNIPISGEDLWTRLGGRNAPVGEAFVRSASNIRLRELVFGYQLPQYNATISLVGRNLFFFKNDAEYLDPEITAGTANIAEGREAFAPPTTRTFGLSLNVQF